MPTNYRRKVQGSKDVAGAIVMLAYAVAAMSAIVFGITWTLLRVSAYATSQTGLTQTAITITDICALVATVLISSTASGAVIKPKRATQKGAL